MKWIEQIYISRSKIELNNERLATEAIADISGGTTESFPNKHNTKQNDSFHLKVSSVDFDNVESLTKKSLSSKSMMIC